MGEALALREVEEGPAAVATVFVAGDGEEPGAEIGVLGEIGRVAGGGEPGVLEEIFGELAAPGEAEKKAEDPRLIEGIHVVERRRLTPTEPGDQRCVFRSHGRSNARSWRP